MGGAMCAAQCRSGVKREASAFEVDVARAGARGRLGSPDGKVLMFHIGTNNWQRQDEFAPGSGILHASMHETFNSMPGVRCYSIFPSKVQTNPGPAEDDTFRIFKLKHDIPICESVSPNSSFRWHSMKDAEFTAYRKRLEDEVCKYMDDIEAKEGMQFDYIISHHAFANAMTGAQILERRQKEGNKKLRHFNFVHGTALKMYIKEKDGDPEYPMRFLKVCKDHGVFTGDSKTAGIWVNSEDYISKFVDCFPSYPRGKLLFSRIGVNTSIFCPKGTTVAKDLERHVREDDKGKLVDIKRVVTFVGKFADWKRLDAVLHAAAVYEKTFPELGTVVVGTGPPEAIEQYEGLARKLGLKRTFFVGAQKQDVLAELFSMSEVGMFPSYKEPFGMVFIECMACGTPTIGCKSGGPIEFVTSAQGVLIEEEEAWRTEAGIKRLGNRLGQTVTQALKEDWKGKSKGPTCVPFVRENYSTIAQCQTMLDNMYAWSKPRIMFHIGTNNWQRQDEFAPGSGILHASMHQTFNSMPGVKCYSIYPSKVQTDPEPSESDTFRIFKLDHDIPICESISPNSNFRWHSMDDDQFAAYRKRLEDAVCDYMDEIEAKEGREIEFLISHHAFTNAMTAAQIVKRRAVQGKAKLRHFNFVHGTALKMYIKEKDGDPEYPMRFLKTALDHGVFTGDSQTVGIWVNSEDYINKFADCFPSFPRGKLVFSRIGVNTDVFCPKGTTVAKDLGKYVQDVDRSKLSSIKKVVTFVGKFADWKRLDAVLYAAAVYEKTFPELGTVVVGTGPKEAIEKYEGLANKLGLKRTLFVGAQKQDVLAELFSMSEVGMFPSYKEPFGMVFIECMACGTPTIGCNSGGPVEFVRPDQGVLIEEEEAWRTEAGIKKLGDRLAGSVALALREDWKGTSKGPTCVPFVKENYSTLSQCQSMLDNMVAWSNPQLMFHIGTNNWQRQGEFAPGSGILHASMHQTFNSIPGVKCYSIFPSKSQTDPEPSEDSTFKIFKLDHDIPICESVSPNSSYRWHSMNDEQFAAYRKRLENEICEYMDEIERKEGREFDFLISHHAFTNAMTGAQVVERRRLEGKTKLKHFNFVHGTALKMYIKEKEKDPEYPLRFLKICQDHGVFTGDSKTSGIWVNSVDYISKFSLCFPSYPKGKLVFSRIGVNMNVFCPKGTTVAKDLQKYARSGDASKLSSIKKIVTFVGKFADWKRLDAVLHAAAVYEKTFPNLGTVVVGTGPPEAIEQYEGLAKKLGLQRTLFVGAQGQDVLAELFSMSEVGMFPSYKEPFGMVFIECMACGTPTIGCNSGGPTEFITPELGVLIDEEEEWRTESGIKRLGQRLAGAVTTALKEDWKGATKGPQCISFVQQNYSTLAQCQGMLSNMRGWSEPLLMFHIGTNNWQRQGEFAPGSGILHASMHQTFNSMPGVKCYSIYPSKKQTDPEPSEDDTFRIFKLDHDIPICESVSPNSSFRWHSMNDSQFTAYRKRLEDEICTYMDEIEAKEGREFDFLVSHHAFTNAMTAAQIVERRRCQGKTKLKHFNFVHGTALKMYIKEKDGDPEYPMRFLQTCRDHGVFTGDSKTTGIWVNSMDYIEKFADCFPEYPRNKLVFSRIGVNTDIFCPKPVTIANDLEKHLRDDEDKSKLSGIKRVVTFVGKLADWKRPDAVLHAAAIYEKTFPDVATVMVGGGPPEAIEQYEGLAKKLGLKRTLWVGAKGQDVLAELFSLSEVGMFPSYKEPFGMVFIECMACGTPTIGCKSGGPVEFVRPEQGVLIEEEEEWRTEVGIKRLGETLAKTVSQALQEDWKGTTKGPTCMPFVKQNYSTMAQCHDMLTNMLTW